MDLYIRKLKELQKRGINIHLCTAKPYFAIKQIINDSQLNSLHITDGGGVIINPIDNIIAKKHIINNKVSKHIL